jgi:hypothetical protein
MVGSFSSQMIISVFPMSVSREMSGELTWMVVGRRRARPKDRALKD